MGIDSLSELETMEVQGIWIEKDGITVEQTIGEVSIDTTPKDFSEIMPDELEIDGYSYFIRR